MKRSRQKHFDSCIRNGSILLLLIILQPEGAKYTGLFIENEIL